MEPGAGVEEAKAAAAGASVALGEPGPRVGTSYTPLYRAQHEDRYLRQDLIRQYQDRYGCNLAVMIDQITDESVTLFAELIHDLDTSRDLHLMLCSPGGDGETAVRLARIAQSACARFVVVVPEIAKSAATILALGAHEIIMGPTSDLGPIDPQVLVSERGYYSAKDLIAAVDRILQDVADRPDTYPLHAAMLGDIDVTTVQFARSALARTGDLAMQAIGSNPDRDERTVRALCAAINEPLIAAPHSHAAVIGADEARRAGLPVTSLLPSMDQWRSIWALWTRYFAIGPPSNLSVYEGERASQVRRFE